MRIGSCVSLIQGLVFLSLTLPTKQKKLVPSLDDSLTGPLVRMEGDDALLTCVVRNLSNYTIMWKKTEKEKAGAKILTANGDRLTSDPRIDVLHEVNGDVYVLLVQNTTMKDAGMYICEVNSDPVIRSFHQLTLLSSSLQPPEPIIPSSGESEPTSSSPDSLSVWGYSTARPIQHDFKDCCLSRNVSSSCLGFCDLNSILSGETGTDPAECEPDFPGIAACMADGRDHMPCCQEAGIPEACTDLCRGEYTIQTDNIKTHFSCAPYTAPTLACIGAGIDLLPGPPQELAVSALNESSIQVTWSPPQTDPQLNKQFVINITYIQFLSPVFSVSVDSSMARKYYPPYSKLYRLPANITSLVISELETFSIYEVFMWTEGVNKGKSLATYVAKVVTHIEGENAADSPTSSVDIPDIKQCCRHKNVSHDSCVDIFCDPHSMKEATVTDMMICAPWDTEIFGCLADGRDHTPCCAAKQLPAMCQELCTGNVTNINFKYFRCISYMHDLSSCLLEGYGVLPSAPVNFRFSNVDTSYGILHWEPPTTLGDTVKEYVVTYQMMDDTHGEERNLEHAKSPFILENLTSSTTYEVYVSAVNDHGVGEESSRIVFRTATRKIQDLQAETHPYNQTHCCITAEVKSECLPLCSYNANMSDIQRLADFCQHDMSKVMRCLVGGRDHLPCCERRGVPQSCQPLCQAVHQKSTGADFNKCLPFMGQVFTCLEEGTIQLPPPISALRAVQVSDGKVVLSWRSDDTDATFNTTHFEVYYKKLEDNSTGGTVFSSDNMLNSTVSRATIDDLETGQIYRFFVVARNNIGTSLPSSLLRLNVSMAGWDGTAAKGTSSPPHLLEVESHSATWLQLTWNPPAITHPEDVLKYRLFFRQASWNTTEFVSVETDVTTVKVENLIPNSQYIIYTTAVIYNNDSDYTLTRSTQESEPSETLIAWTDPAFPAFVEVRIIKSSETNKFTNFAPTVHPINMVTEGSSMTVLCIAMGTPLPTVTLYINGHPVRSDVTRHMVTVVHNVTRDMGDVSCYADNGYGTPMQASRKITISRKPTVRAPAETTAISGDELVIKCKVDAFPAPTIAVFRDKELKNSIQNGNRISLSATASSDDPASFTVDMRIKDIRPDDGGKYYCHANNTLGDDVAFMGVNVTGLPPAVYDRTECCKQQNVSSDCLDICSFSIDFDTLLRKPYCLPEFHKLMKCASDGSDHRHCCHNKGVPNECINWCRGQPVEKTEICALSQSKEIIGCFHEGNRNLPSPPRNIMVRLTSKSSAMVYWDAPAKNPDSVELYRVFWRPLGSKETMKNDTIDHKLSIENLVGGTTYELVVKAGNSNGTSHLTEPLKFATGDEVIIETSMRRSSGATEVVGIIIAVVIVCAILALVLLVLKKKNMLLSPKNLNSPTVAFENPFYSTREHQSSSPEIGQDSAVEISSSGSWQGEMELQNPSPVNHTETDDRNPSLFSGIKFGRSGQGFQRFT